MSDFSKKLAREYIMKRTANIKKTAGEVRFVKDRSGDEKQWGWATQNPSTREINTDFTFNPKNLEPLARSLRSSLIAMGHALSAYSTFTKVKSAAISPDGSLGGRGYIMKIVDIRRQLMNCIEALSAVTDTLYDEMHAPHWNPALKEQGPRERTEVTQIMNDVEEIRSNPEEWAGDVEEDLDSDNGSN
jgi:hypothetical protein